MTGDFVEYVCKVGGNITFPELSLMLSYNEVIDLNQEDFKICPRLRESLKNGEIVVYSPFVHKGAKKVKKRDSGEVRIIHQETRTINQGSDLTRMTKVLQEISDKFDTLLLRVEKMSASLENLKITKVVNSSGNYEYNQRVDSDLPVFVPEIDVSGFGSKIVAKEEKSEGTDDILAQLRKLKETKK